MIARARISSGYLDQPLASQLQLALVVIGGLFWAQAVLQPEEFSADMFGRFALMFPAEMWAMAMMAPAAMVWIGLRNPIKHWMVAVGSGLQTVQFLALGYSTICTGGDFTTGSFCSVLFAPIYAKLFWEAVRDGV